MSSHLTFKILVVGDEDVGKTTIVNHYTLMPASFGSTVGIEFQSRMVALSADSTNALQDNLTVSENQGLMKISSAASTMGLQKCIKHYDHVKCYFWDTSGSPRYQSLSHTYYKNISAAIVVFDLSNEKTYTDLHSYIHRIIQKNSCTHKHPILVIGNKFDKRKINKTRIQIYDDLCHEFPNENIKYAEVSCLDKVYIDDKLNTNNKFNTVFNCANCADSSELHSTITSFLQFAYDSAVKPHFYNPNAISAIGCSGVNGTTRFFTMKKEHKEDLKSVVADENTWKFGRVPPLKTPRQCCDEHYYSYSSASASYSNGYSAGCSSCSIL